MLTVKGIEKWRERYKAREIIPVPKALTPLVMLTFSSPILFLFLPGFSSLTQILYSPMVEEFFQKHSIISGTHDLFANFPEGEKVNYSYLFCVKQLFLLWWCTSLIHSSWEAECLWDFKASKGFIVRLCLRKE